MSNENYLSEIKAAQDAQNRAWEEFKNSNENRLESLEASLREAQLKGSRPNFGGAPNANDNLPEMKSLRQAVHALLSGNQTKADELFIEAKAMSTGTDPDGGYVVHPYLSSQMTKVMEETSPLYRLARKVQLDKGDRFVEPVDKDTAEANWIGETASRGDTNTPELGWFECPLHEIFAMPKATQKLIDLAFINIIDWLGQKVGTAFAVKEGLAFHLGDGVAQPRGILTYTTVATADATRAWGSIEHIATGTSGSFPAAMPSDVLVDVVTALKPQYRAGAVWLMNRRTASTVRKLKDPEGRYVWADSLTKGQPSTLLGYGVEIDEDMPDIGANTLSIAFGDFAQGYTIPDHPGVRYLADPFTDKPNVRLYAYRRVGGGVNNFEAIKFLKFSTT